MYRAIVVDDDVAVLEFLERLIPWNEMGFELPSVYTNALDAIKEGDEAYPDLVITDIGMPEMNGLTFIRKLKADSPDTRYVILSCHDEFQYAQQAVQLGVQEYILKETLNVDNIVSIVKRVKHLLDHDHDQRQEVKRLHDQAKDTRSVRKEKWLRSLLSDPLGDDQSLLKQLQEYGLNPKLGHFIPVLWRMHSFQSAMFRYKKEDIVKFIVENAAEELLNDEPDVLFFSYSAQEFCLFYAFKKDLTTNPYDKLVRVSQMLQKAFSKYLKLEFSVIVGEMATHRAALKQHLSDLLIMADQFFYSDVPVIVKARELNIERTEEDLFLHYSDYAERFNRLLIDENRGIVEAVDSFIQFIKSNRFQTSTVKQFIWKLVLDMQLKLKFSIEYDKEKVQQTIGQMININEIRAWLIQFMNDAVVKAEKISKNSKKTEIIDAQKYVQIHLDRKITLEEVADLLHLNPSYFSRLYKKETGENFIEFVTRLKMEKAKELIVDSDRTVEKVALMLGYDNKSYFVKLFKQHFGVSPSRFV
ncbi:MAG: response regulator [Candidatus Cohnella colombiensis]|uniref:Response regulator n=1 Tax=Candidatus Cohnella colombiensis TaxID=3121368 RepID=A0AA95F191_9BACL|nr:MAG: response regulator [Cohnella sp.]